jgi:hypothetical protein
MFAGVSSAEEELQMALELSEKLAKEELRNIIFQ